MKKFKFTISGNQYDVQINDIEDNIADLEVNGTQYKVEIHQEAKKIAKTPKLVRKPVQKAPGEGEIQKRSSKAKAIKAPLPGTILSIAVKEGDTVTKGQTLMVMEAMKMENSIMAEADGTVAAIKVSAGQSVLQDDVLVEIA
ncbi:MULTISPECIES: biotin/lipoyl-containing protein [Prolixibacter]|uniref:Acetyl-CoA carboxylase biotin carboxyl carrier protein subunit n=1 Tax=Prolixibacter denitrificans TaxID=1541063 RepID=A0A2P8CEH5_9BACT|nr:MULTISPECIES: biotin/lipoyl-containing protein [Prolixibacter]PSK83384.1 biotin-dependent enzyme [Prolixibacter denitrificans]GET21735.1 acetyl-CoA carboxylase biotin carboxyl carrier protein subunit [Prolixibacter denitrificans]GET24349.1 acetyl-CoA carboxylase biotin carboxyl carrier protein subunit [Prolixibacter sp. NT017]